MANHKSAYCPCLTKLGDNLGTHSRTEQQCTSLRVQLVAGKVNCLRQKTGDMVNFRSQLPSFLSAVLEIAWDFCSYIEQIETTTVTCRWKPSLQRLDVRPWGYSAGPWGFLKIPEDPHHSPTLRSSSLVVIFFLSFHSFLGQLVKTVAQLLHSCVWNYLLDGTVSQPGLLLHCFCCQYSSGLQSSNFRVPQERCSLK